jgi:Ice-binding-like
VLAVAAFSSAAFAAQPSVGLGTAGSYGILAGSAITNTGSSVITGDVGITPDTASSVTGFPPGLIHGTLHTADGPALQAQTDLTTAYNDAAGRTPFATVPADIGGQTLLPGVYQTSSAMGLTGSLTLNAQGDSSAVFIFKAGSTLTTASAASINLINGAQACNVFWQVGSSATLGTTTTFVGTIMALSSISVDNGVNVNGRLLARNGAVTLINDTITTPACAAGTVPTPTPGTTPTPSPTPTLGSTGASGSVVPLSANDTAHWATGVCINPKSRRVHVVGTQIANVVFSRAGEVISTKAKSPFTTLTGALAPSSVTAKVTFTDGAVKTLQISLKACPAAPLAVAPKPKPVLKPKPKPKPTPTKSTPPATSLPPAKAPPAFTG